MKVDIEDQKLENPVFSITIPDELIHSLLQQVIKLLSIQEDSSEDTKQTIRSTRMLIKSALIVTGDKIRTAIGIYGKPSKGDDVVDWYVTNISNKIVECVSSQEVALRVEVRNEDAIVTEIYTKSI